MGACAVQVYHKTHGRMCSLGLSRRTCVYVQLMSIMSHMGACACLCYHKTRGLTHISGFSWGKWWLSNTWIEDHINQRNKNYGYVKGYHETQGRICSFSSPWDKWSHVQFRVLMILRVACTFQVDNETHRRMCSSRLSLGTGSRCLYISRLSWEAGVHAPSGFSWDTGAHAQFRILITNGAIYN